MTNMMENVKEFFGLGTQYEQAVAVQEEFDEQERYYARPATIVVVEVTTFDDAPRIGAPFRDGDCVIFDMTEMEVKNARRIVDFASGLCFAVKGRMESLERQVFALVPEGADVTKDQLIRSFKRSR